MKHCVLPCLRNYWTLPEAGTQGLTAGIGFPRDHFDMTGFLDQALVAAVSMISNIIDQNWCKGNTVKTINTIKRSLPGITYAVVTLLLMDTL